MGEACNSTPIQNSRWSQWSTSSQHVETQLDAWHIIQVDDGPFEAKADHAVEVIRSHYYLPLSNMKGVSSIPPPLNKALNQGSTYGPFQKKANDKLKARFPDKGPDFRKKNIVPLHHWIRGLGCERRR